jgi:putative IMPACT (imprinted ancient) family translation regulator
MMQIKLGLLCPDICMGSFGLMKSFDLMGNFDITRGEVFTQKGSKFFGFLVHCESVAAFDAAMAEIKREHKKASHYCFAYVIEEPVHGAQIPMFDDKANYVRKEKYSNDGEPSGVGMALLNVLKQNKFVNRAIIVVRYFGGVLLGAGNLIRAYASAGKLAIHNL